MLWSVLFISLIESAHFHVGDIALCNTQSLTLTGETSQSSDYSNRNVPYSAKRAIDGYKTICAHTNTLQNSWWKIDLLGVYNISCISIYNKEGNTDMSGARIHVGNSCENNGTNNSICITITKFQIHTWNNFTCNSDVSGRYITVSLPKHHPLVLCEVKIYGTKKESPFVLIKQNMTWEEAVYHCRDKHMDLASILDQETQTWAELEARQAETAFVWLGLHYTCTLEFWFWVEDHCLEFNRWAPNVKTEECDMSAAMETKEEHLWFRRSDYEKFNFICKK